MGLVCVVGAQERFLTALAVYEAEKNCHFRAI
jgi:hypothetical protein